MRKIITENYQLVYQSRGKCEIYWNTDVSKNLFIVLYFTYVNFLNFDEIFKIKICYEKFKLKY